MVPAVKCLLVVAMLFVVAVLAAGAATGAASTSAPATQPAPVALTEADAGKTVSVSVGSAITVTLAGNATTGYSWVVGKIDGDALVAVGEVQYTPDNARGVVGSGGRSQGTFRAVKEGKATLTMNYARPWEKDVPPVKTFTVTVEVKAK